MSIRNSSKALIINNNKILVNQCRYDNDDIYYDLPGGGQNELESMEEALFREVLEETGYEIRILRFATLTEEIYIGKNDRIRKSGYAHRITHIFLAELSGNQQFLPTEHDLHQEKSVWLPLEQADTINLLPAALKGKLSMLLHSSAPSWLGCHYVQ